MTTRLNPGRGARRERREGADINSGRARCSRHGTPPIGVGNLGARFPKYLRGCEAQQLARNLVGRCPGRRGLRTLSWPSPSCLEEEPTGRQPL